jgi:hypothetical protein
MYTRKRLRVMDAFIVRGRTQNSTWYLDTITENAVKLQVRSFGHHILIMASHEKSAQCYEFGPVLFVVAPAQAKHNDNHSNINTPKQTM